MPDQTTISFAEALLDVALSIIEDLKLRQWGHSEAGRAIARQGEPFSCRLRKNEQTETV